MSKKIKVPIERQFNGTEKLLLTGIINKILFILYPKKSFISRCCSTSFILLISRGIVHG